VGKRASSSCTAVWAEERDIAEDEVVRGYALKKGGFDPRWPGQRAATAGRYPHARQYWREAVEKGVFACAFL